MSLNRVWIPSPNFSSRGGANVRILVLHTAEGARTYQDLGHFFQGNVQASSHVGADDTHNTVGEYVHPQDKAWTVAAFNPVSENIEMCAFSDWSLDEWHRHPNMLANCAAWIAEEAKRYNIPIEALTPNEAQGGGRGVCQHKDLGIEGGGHHDCGPNFPMQEVLTMARGGSPAPPTPEDYMGITACQNAQGVLHIFVEAKDGDIFYTFQSKGQNSWNGGEPGKRIAGLTFFAPAPK
jgi:hypothetical protein